MHPELDGSDTKELCYVLVADEAVMTAYPNLRTSERSWDAVVSYEITLAINTSSSCNRRALT